MLPSPPLAFICKKAIVATKGGKRSLNGRSNDEEVGTICCIGINIETEKYKKTSQVQREVRDQGKNQRLKKTTNRADTKSQQSPVQQWPL